MFFNFLVKKSNFFFRPLGLQLNYINKTESNKYKWLLDYNINQIIDVGANQGQFALKINAAIKPQTIYCFEPTSIAFQQLKQNTEGFINIKIYNIGIGEENKFLEININSHSPSSSFLELADYHKKSYPQFFESTKEIIDIKTIDYLVDSNQIPLSENTLLKIDVQGFEKFVLMGAKQALKKIKMLYIEVSFIQMYANQPLFKEIYDFLTNEKFQFIGADNLASDEQKSQPLFFDAYFIRKD